MTDLHRRRLSDEYTRQQPLLNAYNPPQHIGGETVTGDGAAGGGAASSALGGTLVYLIGMWLIAALIGLGAWSVYMGVANGNYNIVQDRNLDDFKQVVAEDVAMLQATDAANLILVMNRIQVVNETVIALDEEVDETRTNLTVLIQGRVRTINNVSSASPDGTIFLAGIAPGIEITPSITANTLEIKNTGVITINGQVPDTVTGDVDFQGQCGINVTSGPMPFQVVVDACALVDVLNNLDATVTMNSLHIAALNVSDANQQIQIDALQSATDFIIASINGTVIDFNVSIIQLFNDIATLQNQVSILTQTVQNLTAAQMPIGIMLPFGGTVVPDSYLLCDGAQYATGTYPELFAVIGSAYCPSGGGCAGGAFAVPDMRGHVPVGMDSTPLFGTRGSVVGTTTVNLTTSQLPSHNHGIQSSGTHQHDVWLGFSSSMVSSSAGNCFNGGRIYDVMGGGTGMGFLGTGHFFPTSGICQNFSPNGDAEWYQQANQGSNFPPFNGAAPGGDHNHGGSTQAAGSGSSHPNVQPTVVIGGYIIRYTNT